MDYFTEVRTPTVQVPSQNFSTCPRDVLLVVGDGIIEASMAMRCRFFEHLPYRSLVTQYFNAGARWTAAPKPSMSDQMYEYGPTEATVGTCAAVVHPLPKGSTPNIGLPYVNYQAFVLDEKLQPNRAAPPPAEFSSGGRLFPGGPGAGVLGRLCTLELAFTARTCAVNCIALERTCGVAHQHFLPVVKHARPHKLETGTLSTK